MFDVLEKFTTKYRFPDGVRVSVLHRYALRIEMNERQFSIGFERALEPGVGRLIHENSIEVLSAKNGVKGVASGEAAEILSRVVRYCEVKGLTYRIV